MFELSSLNHNLNKPNYYFSLKKMEYETKERDTKGWEDIEDWEEREYENHPFHPKAVPMIGIIKPNHLPDFQPIEPPPDPQLVLNHCMTKTILSFTMGEIRGKPIKKII